ncbi:MAG: hypothetical protein QOF99_5334, partial [Pseudonocardiales bacterium]|nr:hypothetical protein [Pseudonocardiales bacterium]
RVGLADNSSDMGIVRDHGRGPARHRHPTVHLRYRDQCDCVRRGTFLRFQQKSWRARQNQARGTRSGHPRRGAPSPVPAGEGTPTSDNLSRSGACASGRRHRHSGPASVTCSGGDGGACDSHSCGDASSCGRRRRNCRCSRPFMKPFTQMFTTPGVGRCDRHQRAARFCFSVPNTSLDQRRSSFYWQTEYASHAGIAQRPFGPIITNSFGRTPHARRRAERGAAQRVAGTAPGTGSWSGSSRIARRSESPISTAQTE